MDDDDAPGYTTPGFEIVASDLGPDEPADEYEPADDAPDEQDDEQDDDLRPLDLAPRPPCPSPARKGRALTPVQRRVAEAWGDIPRRGRGAGLTGEFEGSLADAGIILEDGWSRENDEADQWLAREDPQYQRNCVEAEIRKAGATVGLSLAEMRGAFAKGKPCGKRKVVRAQMREALSMLWEDGRNRTLVAEVLGCHRDSLYSLMR